MIVFLQKNIIPLFGVSLNAVSLFVGLYGQSVALKAIAGSLGCLGIFSTLVGTIRQPSGVSQHTLMEMGEVQTAPNGRRGYRRMPSPSLSPYKDDVRGLPSSPPMTPPPRSDANTAAVFPPDPPLTNRGEGRKELKEIADKFSFIVDYKDSFVSTEPPVWCATVFVNDVNMGSGVGRGKAIARDAAAKEAVQRLKDQHSSSELASM